MSDRPKELDNRVIVLNGFTDPEIVAIMNVVKSIYADADLEKFFANATKTIESKSADEFTKRLLKVVGAAKQIPEAISVSARDLIFAKTTENSVQMRLVDLIVDMSGDHEYLKENPPASQPAESRTDQP